jgi:outer membrane lipoprotein-sorting protein
LQIGVDKPRVLSVSPASGSEMALISELQVVFDRPMMPDQFEIVDASLEDKYRYLSKVSAIEAYAVYDENKYQFTIPLMLPCNWNGSVKLGGFKSVKGVDAEPLELNYSTFRENFSKDLFERFEKAKESQELRALVEKVKEMRSNLKSLSETVKVVWDYGDEREKREQQMVFKMQGDKQFYADMSRAFDMPWHIGSDGDKCWYYYESKREKKLVMTDFDDIAEKNIAICEPFGVGKYDVDEAIKLNNLEYIGTETLDGRKFHLVRAWSADVQIDRTTCQVNTWWINAETYMPVQLVTDSGRVIRSQYIIYEKINQPIDDSKFRPDFITDMEPEKPEPLGEGHDTRFINAIDGSGTGRMSVRWGKRGPAGTSSSGLN